MNEAKEIVHTLFRNVIGRRLGVESAVNHRALTAPRAAFANANRFEILFLETAKTDDADETYSVSRFRSSYRVVDTEKLSERQNAEFKNLLSDHVLSKEFSAMCHAPRHAIRAFEDSDLIFEATFCLECVNMDFAAFGLIPVEVPIFQKDHSVLDLPLLENFLSGLREEP